MTRFALLFALLACGAVGCAAQAHPASEGGYSIQIVDQWGGSLATYSHRGSIYVLGVHGDRYGVKISNHTSQRVEAVVTVDGRDVISGRPGSYTQRGYLVDAYGSITVEGFRQSNSAVATFRFTNPSDSYSARMGTPQNVGVVGVAVFKERARPMVRPIAKAKRAPRSGGFWGGAGSAEGMEDSAAEASPAPAKRSSRGRIRPQSTNNIGTQYGERRQSAVVEVPFKRRSGSPDQVLSTYYDDARGLQARGIRVYPRHNHMHAPQPFPSDNYAPPPPR